MEELLLELLESELGLIEAVEYEVVAETSSWWERFWWTGETHL